MFRKYVFFVSRSKRSLSSQSALIISFEVMDPTDRNNRNPGSFAWAIPKLIQGIDTTGTTVINHLFSPSEARTDRWEDNVGRGGDCDGDVVRIS